MAKRGASSNLDRDNWEKDDPPEEVGIFQKASSEQMKTRLIQKAKRRIVQDGPAVPVFQNFAGFGVKSSNSSPAFNFLAKPTDSATPDAPMFGSKDKSDADGVNTVFSFGGKSTVSKTPTFNFGSNNEKSDTNSRENKSESCHIVNKESPSISKFGFTPKPILEQSKVNETFSFRGAENKSEGKENISGFTFNSKPSCDDKSSTSVEKVSPPSPKINGDRSKSPHEASNSNQNKTYLSHLKSLNLGLINWVKKHVDKNPYVDLSPVFEDYKSYFSDLKKKYKCSGDSGQNSSLENQPKISFGSTPVDKADKQPPMNSKREEKMSTISSPLQSYDLKQTNSSSKSLDSSTVISASVTADSNTSPSFNFGSKSTPPSKSSSVADFFKATDSTANKPFTFSADSSKSLIFGGANKPTMFNFGSGENKTTAATFNFGTPNAPSATEEAKQTEADGDEPPKLEVKEVKEEDALYEKKVKLFYKKDGSWADKGVGTLFLKKVEDKTQLIVRAFTNLGNILLNIILNDSIPTQRQGKNNVLIVCVPNPPIDPKSEDRSPVSMLIRVKTAEDADELLKQIETHKK